MTSQSNRAGDLGRKRQKEHRRKDLAYDDVKILRVSGILAAPMSTIQ